MMEYTNTNLTMLLEFVLVSFTHVLVRIRLYINRILYTDHR